MTSGLRPYRAMKDSGVPWLGEVPEHWGIEPIGRSGQLFKGNGGNKGDEVSAGVPCVRYGDLYTKHEFFIRTTKAYVTPERVAAYTPIRHGDVLFAASGETIEDIGRSAVNLIESEACCGGDVLVFRPNVEAVAEFLGYATDSAAARQQKACMGRGFTVVHIYAAQLKRLVLPLPPLPEQAAIVRFLDHASRRIRHYIRAKQKLIRLLEEQKQAIIHRAAARGLDPDVRLKPSGVEWLGEVPEHWEIARLKDAADVQTGLTLGKNYNGVATESRPYLRVANVQVGRVDLTQVKRIDVPPKEARGATLQSGDVLMTEGGDIDKLGRGCVWRDEIPGCLHQNHVFAVRCRQHLLASEFLVGLMASQHGRNYFQLTAKQTTNLASTNSTTLRAFPIMLPPLAEQQAILDEIRKQTTGIESALVNAQRGISLLREYRTRLIADVVTGKLDVRDAAARLPDGPLETELDEADAMTDAEDATADDLDVALEEAEARTATVPPATSPASCTNCASYRERRSGSSSR